MPTPDTLTRPVQKYSLEQLEDLTSTVAAAAQKKLNEELERQRAQELRARQEQMQKFEEHQQRLKLLQEAEYDEMNQKRAKAQDEFAWTNFETKIVKIMKRMLEPVFELSTEDRALGLELQVTVDNLK